MRLKTKFQDEDFELGEVVNANIYYGGNGRIKVIAEPVRGGMITFYFETLKGMNEMFEDYEEPKRMQWVDVLGANDGRVVIQYSNEEEAEKAVERLRAWKRLRDKGFSIYSWDYEFDMVDKPSQTIILRATAVDTSNTDLDLLFGGEE